MEPIRPSSRPGQPSSTATTSTPTRSCPSSSSSASSAPGFGEFLFYDWAKEPGWDLPRQPDPRDRRELRLRLRRASTRRGGCRTTASRRSSRRASPTSSTPTARRSGCCRSCSRRGRRAARSRAAGRRPRSTSPPRRSASPDGEVARFEIDHEIRHRLLNGLDDIALTLQQDDEIAAYERDRERSGPVTTALVASADDHDDRHCCPATGSGPRSPPPTSSCCERSRDFDVRGARLRRRLDRRPRRPR